MLERCIICLWAIWRARNDLVFNGVLDRQTDIALKLNSFLKLYYRSALNRKNTPWFHGSIHQGGNFQNKVGLNWIVMHLITRMQLGLALFLEILQGQWSNLVLAQYRMSTNSETTWIFRKEFIKVGSCVWDTAATLKKNENHASIVLSSWI